MAWYLQTPNGPIPKLLKNILDQCALAEKGAAAFAFASAQGVKMLAAEPAFIKFLNKAELAVIIGLDAITDTKAVDQLRKLNKSHPNFKPKFFLHSISGSLFHPKTMWLKTPKGGVIITGSGNLTAGGLSSNWEAMAIQMLTPEEMVEAEKSWSAWLKAHAAQLFDLDDPKVLAKAEANKRLRARIKKAISAPKEESKDIDPELEAVGDTIEEIEKEVKLNPMLIAEIPKASDRWEQANFDKRSFIEFFGVTLGKAKSVRFFNVQPDGSLVAEAVRPPVAVKSRNFRFELKAAKGLKYPKRGVPIAVFERVGDSDFNYVLLMPGQNEHKRLAEYLDADHPKKSHVLRRIQITAGDFQKIWPDAPFFL